jgi:hypothetical protein
MNQEHLHTQYISKDTSRNRIINPHTIGIVDKDSSLLIPSFFLLMTVTGNCV